MRGISITFIGRISLEDVELYYFFCSALFWALDCSVLLKKTNKVLLDNVMWSKVDTLFDQRFLLSLSILREHSHANNIQNISYIN